MMRNTVSSTNSDLLFIVERIREFGGIERLGHIFRTLKNGYYYDSGTGKVICLEPDEYLFFEWLFDKSHGHDYEDFCSSFPSDEFEVLLDNIRKVVEEEHLFQAPIKTEFISPMHKEELDKSMQEKVRMITLELTEQCNLRCGYCIYNDEFDKERGFSKNEMSIETVKAAIDFLAKYGDETVAIAFYGGEPLLKFELIKYAVEYSKQHIQGKTLTYSMTSNMTLMTREMADFFASVDDFSILCSIDGPEEIHDKYRKYSNSQGSYKNAMRGVRYLAEAHKERFGNEYKRKMENQIMFSMVFTPPFTKSKIQRLQNFFEDMVDWLPLGIRKTVTYVENGTLNEEEFKGYKELIDEEFLYAEPLMNWTLMEYDNKDDKNLFTQKILTESLLRIHNRPLLQEPGQPLGINGCCVPGVRKSYICANGDIKLCEKIGISPSIGNVFSGFDKKAIVEKYIDGYEEKTIKECNECWAFGLCGVCYARNYTETDIDLNKRFKTCFDAKNNLSMLLMNYHHILEIEPEGLLYLNDIISE